MTHKREARFGGRTRNQRYRLLLLGAESGNGGGSALVAHQYALAGIPTEITLTSDASWNDIAGAELDLSEFEAGESVLVFATMRMHSSSSATADNQLQLAQGGTGITGQDSQHENMGGALPDGQGFQFMAIVDPADGSITLQNNTNASFTASASDIKMMAISLTDIGEDYYESAATASDVALSTSSADLASISIGDGTNDWLVFGMGRFDNVSAGSNFELRLHDGSAERIIVDSETEDTADILTRGFINVVKAPAAATTVKLTGRSDSPGSPVCTHSVLVAINLGVFEDYVAEYNAGPENPVSGSEYSIDTAQIAALTSDGDVALICYDSGSYPSSGFGAGYTVDYDLNGGTAVEDYIGSVAINCEAVNPNDEIWPEHVFGKDITAESGDEVNASFRVLPAPVSAGQVNTHYGVVMFSWKRA